MRFLFTDDAFSFEALRVTGYAPYGGADLGEVIVTTRQIPDGDEAAWHEHWNKIAERLHAAGEEALRAGHQDRRRHRDRSAPGAVARPQPPGVAL
jgi:hypothetical protein